MAEDDFMIFLVVGLMILAIMLAIFNVSFESQPKDNDQKKYNEVIWYNSSSLVAVGPQKYTAMQVFSFNIDSKNLRGSREIFLGNATLHNGVLFGEKDLKYRISLAGASQMQLSFKVVNSNEMEPLVIQIGGKTVFSKILEPGEYRVDIDNSYLSDDTLVALLPASSGWRIWAPNLYELADIKISAQGYEEQATNFIFNIDEEFDNFAFGKVDLSLGKNVGSLTAILNSRQIYSAPPASGVSFQFFKTDLQKGENILNLIANKDAEFKGIGVITIYYSKEKVYDFRTPLNITKSEYDRVNRTIVRFDVVNVATPGGLALKVQNSGSITFREFASVGGSGSYEFVLGKGELASGFNVLTISSLDGAVFDVANLVVKFR